jgi:hypothetical protein
MIGYYDWLRAANVARRASLLFLREMPGDRTPPAFLTGGFEDVLQDCVKADREYRKSF